MKYNFDEIINRKNTGSIKHDLAARRNMPEDLVSLWVADMDFASPPCVLEALHKRVDHGIFGYTEHDGDYARAVLGWYASRFGWEVDPKWLVTTPGVVHAVCTAIRAFTEPGDAILIQQPVYYPFESSVRENGRRLVNSGLVLRDGRYEMDFDDMERRIVEEKVKLFILCSPHNPVGRVWTREELERAGDICLRYGVLVVADEIHQDFIYPGHRHQVFADLKPEYRDNTITCTAPSKTFNLAGLQISNIFIPRADYRRRFRREMEAGGYSQSNIMGLASCQAAYEGGAEWLEELKEYIRGNLDFVREYLDRSIPRIKLVEPQGTYLIWLDCRELGLDDRELDRFMVDKAGLWLDGGTMFGAGGEGFQRVNIGSPRRILGEAMDRLAQAVGSL